MPSKRAAATWHSEIAIEPSARSRWRAVGAGRRRPRPPSAGRPTRCPSTSSLPSRVAALARAPGRAATPSSVRAARRATATHSSSGPEVVARSRTRRRPSWARRRRRSRAQWCGQPALGVQRAVDRVDHDAHGRVAEVDLAALLGDRGEARARPRGARRARRRRRPRPPASITSVRSPPSPRLPVSLGALGASSGASASIVAQRRGRAPAGTEPVGGLTAAMRAAV